VAEAVVGYCTFHDHFFNHRFVELVVVDVAWRKLGAAHALLHAAIETCPTDRVFGSTNASNGPARALFTKCHFKAVGQLTGLDAGDPEVFYRHSKRGLYSESRRDTGGREIVGPEWHNAVACESVLRSLPQWFGIESALIAYAQSTTRLPTFLTIENGIVVGFVSLRKHFDHAWEIDCLAVRADDRHQGVGTALLTHAEAWLGAQNVSILQVKTLAATNADPNYAETREFYERRGFIELEILPAFWSPENPCLVMAKPLSCG